MMEISLIKILIFLIARLTNAQFNSMSSDCTTPDGLNGRCISIVNCGTLMSSYNDNLSGFNLPFFQQDSLRGLLTSLTTTNRDFLRRSQCVKDGYNEENGKPLVCCPNSSPTYNQPLSIQPNPMSSILGGFSNNVFGNIFNQQPLSQQSLHQQPLNQINPQFSPQINAGQNPQFGFFPNLHTKPNFPQAVNTPIISNHNSQTNQLLPQPGQGACGISQEQKLQGVLAERIVGGITTEINEYPWLAALHYIYPKSGQKSYKCGGALINDRFVLTAAHCVVDVYGVNLKLIGVRLGDYNTTSEKDCVINQNTGYEICNDPVDFQIAKKIIHNDYVISDVHQKNDIALLKLDRKVIFTDFIQPICLPSLSELRYRNYEGNKLVVAGWGRTETGEKSDIKLHLDVDVRDKDYCEKGYYGTHIIPQQICAGGNKGEAPCSGDSGGPLMAYPTKNFPFYYIVGIVSVGAKSCGTEGKPGIFTKVSEYLPWIEINVNV